MLTETPGSVGAFIDDQPLVTTAHVRPYVIAILLHRGAVCRHEIIASIAPHCNLDDLRVGGWDPLDGEYCDGTRLEKIIDEVLGEFVHDHILRYNEEQDLWVLTPNDLPLVISWVSSLGARMPQHLLADMSRQEIARLPDQVLPEIILQ